MRYFIELSYNGKKYHGWQIQPDAVSIQEKVNYAVSTILQEKIEVVGAGRTDTGVHASQMFAHFNVENSIAGVFVVIDVAKCSPGGRDAFRWVF